MSGNISYVLSIHAIRLRLFPIRVSIYHRGSVSLDTSNYRPPGEKVPDRQQKLEPGCLGISVTSGPPGPLVFWIFLISVSICQGGSFSPDTSNFMMPEENGPDRQRKLELDCLEISVISCHPVPLVFGIALVRVCIYHCGSVAPDTSNYRTTMENGPDRQRKLERGCLEISVTSAHSAPSVFGIFLVSVSIYQGVSVSPDTSNYMTPKHKGPIDSAKWNATVWKYRLRVVVPGH